MAASSGDRTTANLSDSARQRILSQFEGDWVRNLDIEQMFGLVDGVLPFEACLYYQVLPLYVEGNRLHLGMVSPDDASASEYSRRIVSYLNYFLVPHPIASEALQMTLTAYLNHSGNQSSRPKQTTHPYSYGHYRQVVKSKADHQGDASTRPTLIVDSPEDLNTLKASLGNAPPEPSSPPLPATEAPTMLVPDLEPEPEPELEPEANPEPELELQPVEPQPTTQIQAIDLNVAAVAAPAPAMSNFVQPIPYLNLHASHLSSPIAKLMSLPAAELLPELLARVLVGGIGRLYFECHPRYGRVLWSQNGVLQSVLDRVPLETFDGLITELKRLADRPIAPVTQIQQVEVERLYERSRLLLRFRFMPNEYGEEATLQVLRGAALKFYQQQLSKLERDALGIAKQLQHKLNEIRDRALAEPRNSVRFEVLPAVGQLLHSIEEQLDDLGVHAEPPRDSSSADDS